MTWMERISRSGRRTVPTSLGSKPFSAGRLRLIGCRGARFRWHSYDNVLAETVNGLYKAELIHARPAWPWVFATMNWVHWWNHQRLHRALDYSTPIESERAYAQTWEPSPAPT